MPIKGIADTAYTTVLPLSLLPLGRPVFTLFGILFLLGLLALAGYEPEFGLILAFLLSTIAANGLTEDSPLFSKTLVQGGRRERFYVTTVRVVVQAALSGLVLLLPILMLNLLMPWLPDVNVFGSSHTFHRIPLGLAMLSMIVFPVVGLLAFCLHGRRSEVIVGVLVVAVQILVIVHLDDVPMVPTPMLVLIGVLAWFAFMLCIHRIALRGDLVRR